MPVFSCPPALMDRLKPDRDLFPSTAHSQDNLHCRICSPPTHNPHALLSFVFVSSVCLCHTPDSILSFTATDAQIIVIVAYLSSNLPLNGWLHAVPAISGDSHERRSQENPSICLCRWNSRNKANIYHLDLKCGGRIVESKNSLENSPLTSFHWLVLITNRDRTIRPHKSQIVTDCSHQSSSWYLGTIENWRTIPRFYRVIMYSHPEILPNVRSSYLCSSFSSSTQWSNVISTPNCIRSEETRYR